MSETNPYAAPTTAGIVEVANAKQQKFAGFGVRLGASILDSIVLMAVQFPSLMAIYGTDYFFQPEVFRPGQVLIGWLFPFVYIIGFWSVRGATPGKMLVGIRIVRPDGSAPHVGQFIGRYFAYFVSSLVFLLGYLWIIRDPRKQGWHDKLANTVVVYTSATSDDG